MTTTNRRMKRSTLYENIDKLEGLTLGEMVERLNTRTTDNNLRAQLYYLRQKGLLTFECKNKRYYHFKITDSKYLDAKEVEAGQTKLSQVKVRLYVEDVLNMREIANNPAIKASDRIKATEAKQKALKHLENEYALELLTSYGLNED